MHYDASSCNGCDIEVLACLTPVYDVERFGIINTGDPKQADIFLITVAVNDQNKEVVKQLYDQMPEPKVVVAVGVCACTEGSSRTATTSSEGSTRSSRWTSTSPDAPPGPNPSSTVSSRGWASSRRNASA